MSAGRTSPEAQAARQARFRLIFENAAVGIGIFDLQGRAIETNPAFQRTLGYSNEELRQMTFTDYLHPDDLEELRKRAGRLLSGEVDHYRVEKRYIRRDGSIVWARSVVTLLPAAEPGVTHILAMFEDITDRKAAEQALLEKDAKLTAFLESAAQGILVINESGAIDMVNRKAEEMFGDSRENLSGKHVDSLLPDTFQRMNDAGAGFLLGPDGQRSSGEAMLARRKDGSTFPVELTFSRVEAEGRRVFICFVTDVTERRRLQSQLLQSQKMEAIGHLAGGVAHDFNNLLTIIGGYTRLVLDTMTPDDASRSSLEAVLGAAERGAALTRQLLAFSRKQPAKPAPIELNSLVRNLEKLLRRLISEDVELVLNLAEVCTEVVADPGQIEQVIVNLVVNARDAMPQGGQLFISTGRVQLTENETREYVDIPAGPYVSIEVRDTGIGMTPELQSHIFEPFFTTKEASKGTGLGLATVYGIVKQSGGAISVRSEPGQGSTFTALLPAARAEAEAEKAAPAERYKEARGNETVLLVEDDDSLRKFIRGVLQRSGYTVIEAANGADALEIASRRVRDIQVVLTDIIMPRMSGRELVGNLQQQAPGIRVLFMSGYTERTASGEEETAGRSAFLRKPFTAADLIRAVRAVLDSPPA